MPTYVYECQKCEKVFEVEQRIIEDALTDCDCGAKNALKRLIQPTAVMFKGSGFYVNDVSSKNSEPVKSAEKSDSPAAPSSTEDMKTTSPATETSPKSDSSDALSVKPV